MYRLDTGPPPRGLGSSELTHRGAQSGHAVAVSGVSANQQKLSLTPAWVSEVQGGSDHAVVACCLIGRAGPEASAVEEALEHARRLRVDPADALALSQRLVSEVECGRSSRPFVPEDRIKGAQHGCMAQSGV